MTMTNTLKMGLRAGVVALALAGTALGSVAPAQAQSNPSFGFSLNFGGGPSAGPSAGPKGGIHLQFGDKNYFKYCLTNSQIERGLSNKGYRDVQIVRESRRDDKVYVVARKGRDYYSMRVDRCSGKVDQVREVRRNRNGGFNLTFNF